MPSLGPDHDRGRVPPISLWQAILDPGSSLPEAWADLPPVDAAGRLADLVTPAMAAHFVDPVSERLGHNLLEPATVRQSRLLNRFNGGVQRHWMAEIARSGIPVVYLKGFVFAHSLYPDPDMRTIGDMDILVREKDLNSLADFLIDQGFYFDPLPLPPWGFISDASFMPLISADGDCNIDLHVQPDCYPAYRSMTADEMFARAMTLEIEGTSVSVPAPEHAMILCLTNAAKDKFGEFSVRKILDIAAMLNGPQAFDWEKIASLAADGHFLKPANIVFALLRALGLPADRIPTEFDQVPQGYSGRAFSRLVSDYAAMFEKSPSALRVLERELTLCTEPDVALHNAGLRIKGLFRRRRGIPDGFAPS